MDRVLTSDCTNIVADLGGGHVSRVKPELSASVKCQYELESPDKHFPCLYPSPNSGPNLVSSAPAELKDPLRSSRKIIIVTLANFFDHLLCDTYYPKGFTINLIQQLYELIYLFINEKTKTPRD